MRKKSISNRVKYAFVTVIILISAGFIFSIYARDIVTRKYDNNMNINIKLSKLSVEISNSWSFFDMYMKTKNKDYIEKYITANNTVEEIFNQISPYIQKNKVSSVYLRNLNNMFNYYKTGSYTLINQEKLDEKGYDQLIELKTQAVYINKYSGLLTVSYLDYSNNEYSSTLKKYKNTQVQIYGMFIIIILGSYILSMHVSKELSITIGKLCNYAGLLSEAKWEIADLNHQKYDELNSLAKAFNKMKNSIRIFIDELNEKAEIESNYHKERLKSAEKDKLIKETHLLALQSQINPHFLFNTLNTISRMAMFENADNTATLIAATSKILRYNLAYKDKLVKLKEEIDMIKAYVTIQQTRFRRRMRFDFDIDHTLESINIPAMIIQPILENAIIHGLNELDQGGIICISVKRQDKFVVISIKDNGKGIEDQKIQGILNNEKSTKEKSDTTGLGVSNVKQRLELYFNRNNLITIDSKVGQGAEVTLFIPIEGGE
ncbi:MAG: histidine kinase [Clostridiaceae bacterium]|nr:histidine kinase [Clostridiaceae bacterium]